MSLKILGQRVTAGLIARQFGLLIRTLLDLSRRPSLGRHFRRMAKSLGRTPLDLRVPWLPYALIEALEGMDLSSSRVFEFGGGGSTAWFADRGANVTTVEHDFKWATLLRSALGGSANVDLLLHSTNDGLQRYMDSIADFPDGHFDVVMVDGRRRVECFTRAIPKVKPGGLLILDDTERKRYACAGRMVDWPRKTFVGWAPCKPTFAYSTVFTRPQSSAAANDAR